ncbi:hypothetical protein HY449_04295 [Candidatus Pacearchaeota archaeon]|nr:hypothetical protein [Candidatus Pacearchaeota archaeon]
MKRNGLLGKILIGAAVIGALSFPLKAFGTEVNAGIALKSQYLASTGFVFSDKPAAYSSLSVSEKGFYGFLGANIGTGEGLNEIDLIAGYKGNIGKMNLDMAVGNFNLINFGGNDNSHFYELYGTLSRPDVITPRIKFAQNAYTEVTDRGHHGRDFEFGLNYDGKGKFPSADFALHYNDQYYTNRTDFSVAQLAVSYPLAIGGFTATPKVRIQKAINRDNFKDTNEVSVSVNRNF